MLCKTTSKTLHPQCMTSAAECTDYGQVRNATCIYSGEHQVLSYHSKAVLFTFTGHWVLWHWSYSIFQGSSNISRLLADWTSLVIIRCWGQQNISCSYRSHKQKITLQFQFCQWLQFAPIYSPYPLSYYQQGADSYHCIFRVATGESMIDVVDWWCWWQLWFTYAALCLQQ